LGKRINAYEWTVFRRYAVSELERLDREFKRCIKKAKRAKLGE